MPGARPEEEEGAEDAEGGDNAVVGGNAVGGDNAVVGDNPVGGDTAVIGDTVGGEDNVEGGARGGVRLRTLGERSGEGESKRKSHGLSSSGISVDGAAAVSPVDSTGWSPISPT